MSRIVVLVAIASCGTETDDDGQDCHYDCFGGAECEGDQLKLQGLGARPIECGAPTPVDYCVTSITTCAMGCKGDGFVRGAGVGNPVAEYQWLCRPAPPAAVGQGCATDDDCRPTFAIPTTSSDEVTQVYLGCGAGGTCEEIDAPILAGYGGPCTAASSSSDARWTEGAAVGDACLFASDFACARSFATRTCAGDWDCPAGSRCDDQVLHATGALLGGVCRPGAAPLRARDLPCTPAT